MRKTHGFITIRLSALPLILMLFSTTSSRAQDSTTGKPAAPPTPTISSVTTTGDYTTVIGTAKEDAKNSYEIKISLCVSDKQPQKPFKSCSDKSSNASEANLLNSEGTINTLGFVKPDKNGNFTVVSKALTEGSYIYLVEDASTKEATLPDIMSDSFTIPGGDTPHYSENFLGLLGVSYAGASSTDPQTKLWANVSADIPIAKRNSCTMWTGCPFKQLHAWGYGRIEASPKIAHKRSELLSSLPRLSPRTSHSAMQTPLRLCNPSK